MGTLTFMLVSTLLVLAWALLWALPKSPGIASLPLASIELLDDYRGIDAPPVETAGNVIALPWKAQAIADTHGVPATTPIRWIRVRFDLAQIDESAYAVYFTYLAPGAAVFADGVYLRTAHGFVSPLRNGWSVPEYVLLPSAMLHAGSNRLDIRFQGINGGSQDIGGIFVGSDARLRTSYQRRLRVQSTGVQIVCLLIAMMGIVTALIGRQRRQGAVFRLFSLSCALSILQNLQFFIDDPPLPASAYLLVCDLATFWLAAVLIHLCHATGVTANRTLLKAGYSLTGVASVALTVFGAGGWLAPLYVCLLLMALAFTVDLSIQTWRHHTVTHALIWCAVVLTTATGAYDLLMQQHGSNIPDVNLLPYGALLFSRAICWVLIDGFIRLHNEREALNQALEQRVQAFGHELDEQYARIAGLERRNAITQERERILRDMHDGLGFQLITAMNRVMSRTLTREELAATFAEALAVLQQALDATAAEHNDLLLALEDLRSRIEAGLHDAGIAVTWTMAESPLTKQLMPEAVAETVRIVQEAFTNAIKHSRASQVHLQLLPDDDGMTRIRVIDEGVGMRADAPAKGEGLLTMRWRAARIGGRLDIHSRPGRTEVVLTLPGAVNC